MGKIGFLAVMMFSKFIGLFCYKERDLDTGVLQRYIKAFPLELLQLQEFPGLVVYL